jgi:galactokinase
MIPMQASLLAQFSAHFGTPATHLAQAPGRVNLIGEHTDYNDGFVLPCAIDFATLVALRTRQDLQVNVLAVNAQFAVDAFDLGRPIAHNLEQPWADYVRGVLSILQKAGLPLRGMDMAIVGDIPQGTGLSSSASLEVAVIAGVCGIHGIEVEPAQWAQWAQQSENQFVGTQCGIMDMWISATAKAECASLLDCRSLAHQHCHVPEGLQLVIINSQVERGLVGSEYNLRRQQCEQAARHFGQSSLRDVSLDQLLAAEADMDAMAFKRARHILTENARTLSMAQALKTDDAPTISRLMAESHASMRDDFEITVPAIDRIVAIVDAIAGDTGGVRMTGGGFGGCVVALLPHQLVQACQAALAEQYRAPSGAQAKVYLPNIGAGGSHHALAAQGTLQPA